MRDDVSQSGSTCGRVLSDKDRILGQIGLDPVEERLLEIARFVFQSFAAPASQSWLHALQLASLNFGDDGPSVFARLVATLQNVRVARTSCYSFNSPTCACCAAIVTEHERRLLRSLAAIRRGRPAKARTEMMMLCEGEDTERVIYALEHLAKCLPAPLDTMLETQTAR